MKKMIAMIFISLFMDVNILKALEISRKFDVAGLDECSIKFSYKFEDIRQYWSGVCKNGYAHGIGIAIFYRPSENKIVAQYHGVIRYGDFEGHSYFARPLVSAGSYFFKDGLPEGKAVEYVHPEKTNIDFIRVAFYKSGKITSEEKYLGNNTNKEFNDLMENGVKAAQYLNRSDDFMCRGVKTMVRTIFEIEKLGLKRAYVLTVNDKDVADCFYKQKRYVDALEYYKKDVENDSWSSDRSKKMVDRIYNEGTYNTVLGR
jgi:hypothetical protein